MKISVVKVLNYLIEQIYHPKRAEKSKLFLKNFVLSKKSP